VGTVEKIAEIIMVNVIIHVTQEIANVDHVTMAKKDNAKIPITNITVIVDTEEMHHLGMELPNKNSINLKNYNYAKYCS
jgi:hypothetical protein